MLIGKSTNSMDSKGRVFMPVKWRVDLTDHLIILIGFGKTADERYLQVMSLDKFTELTRAVESLPPTDITFIKAKRYIFPNSEECSLDKQGRMLIPQDLAKYAGLSGEVRMLGTGDSVQIWNPDALEKVEADYGFGEFAADLQALANRQSNSNGQINSGNPTVS